MTIVFKLKIIIYQSKQLSLKSNFQETIFFATIDRIQIKKHFSKYKCDGQGSCSNLNTSSEKDQN